MLYVKYNFKIKNYFKLKKEVVLSRPGVSGPGPLPTHHVRRHFSVPVVLPGAQGRHRGLLTHPLTYSWCCENTSGLVRRPRWRLHRPETDCGSERNRRSWESASRSSPSCWRWGNRASLWLQGRPGGWPQTKSAFTGTACQSWDIVFGGERWTPGARSKLCSLSLYMSSSSD